MAKHKIPGSAMRGIAAIAASIFAVSTVGTTIVSQYRSKIDAALGTTSYVTVSDEDNAKYKSDYDSVEDLAAAAKDIAVKEGQEGTVVMKNDNNVLPLAANSEVALFGEAAYAPFPYASGDNKAGNDDAVDLVAALEADGITINETLQDFYMNKVLNRHTEEVTNQWTGQKEKQDAFDNIYVSSPGDMTEYQINEVPASKFEELGLSSDWESTIDKDNTVGICVFARGAGEGNSYQTDNALDYDGNETNQDPLKLSEDELSVIDAAKESCGKVIVLINSGNTMVLKDIAAGGDHEVDGIAYIGTINDYQLTGVADVLTGKVNASGGLSDTYVADNASLPAAQNYGGGYYSDYETVASDDDDRYPGVSISNEAAGSFGGVDTYNGGMYYVEAEGIYVGYKYFDTRYYDSVANKDSGASSGKGATQGDSWSYDSEVLYPFGYGLSYLDYTEELKSVDVDDTADGNITATVTLTNNSDTDGTFRAELYVQQPYTDYDKQNGVEKSAVMFLNSAKTEVPAGESKDVTITVPTKYLASYDENGAKTYILDDGDYLFTAANGSHEAVNNFLTTQGYTTDDGMDAEGTGAVVTWNKDAFDSTTYSVDHDTQVTNVAEQADLNYWTGEDTVTYLTRNDWDGTWPVNYNEDVTVTIGDSDKKDEWIQTLRNRVYTIQTDDPAEEGTDQGVRFDANDITETALSDITNEYWDKLVSQITIDEAVGSVIHGGNQSDVLTNVDNPVVPQHEGVSGFTDTYTDEDSGKTYRFNVHSQTLLATSFDPDLAYQWGLVEGNSGLWLDEYELWGTGLTLRRTPYNGRNYEYISEDPMLSNRMGYGIITGCLEKGIINGPKHLGFNDQEHNRAGISAYMNEQKFRETDLRGFQGALEDAGGLGIMIAFNRIGATNASEFSGLLTQVLRNEWGYKGLISTDMMNNQYYFNPESMVVAGVTMVADFAGEDNHLNLGDGGKDATWNYLSVDAVKNDATLVNAARQDLKYQLYAFANSAVMNVSTEQVATWYDNALRAAQIVGLVVAIAAGILWIVSVFTNRKKEEEVK